MVLSFIGMMRDQREHLMVLRESDGDRALVMNIGPAEAAAIAVAVQGAKVERPMTHDLLLQVLDQLQGQLTRVVVHDVRDHAFIGVLDVDTDKGVLEVDCRPSDAVALAARAEIPIFASEHVLDTASINVRDLQRSDDEDVID